MNHLHPAIDDELIAAGGVSIKVFIDRLNEFVWWADGVSVAGDAPQPGFAGWRVLSVIRSPSGSPDSWRQLTRHRGRRSGTSPRDDRHRVIDQVRCGGPAGRVGLAAFECVQLQADRPAGVGVGGRPATAGPDSLADFP